MRESSSEFIVILLFQFLVLKMLSTGRSKQQGGGFSPPNSPISISTKEIWVTKQFEHKAQVGSCISCVWGKTAADARGSKLKQCQVKWYQKRTHVLYCRAFFCQTFHKSSYPMASRAKPGIWVLENQQWWIKLVPRLPIAGVRQVLMCILDMETKTSFHK